MSTNKEISENEIKENILNFLADHKQLLKDSDFKTLYEVFSQEVPSYESFLTVILLNAGINPLEYMTTVPTSYLSFNKDIKEIYIPDGVVAIEKFAFAMMRNLKHLSIPNSVKDIGYDILCGSINVTEIEYRGTEAELSKVNLPRILNSFSNTDPIIVPIN